MKLLAVRSAKSIWLIPIYFLNPMGRNTRSIVEATKARYGFLKSPFDFPLPPKENEGLKFLSGAFNTKSGEVQIKSMTLHLDGIVVETSSSTDDSDAFLEDVSIWMNTEYGLPKYSELPINRLYTSELNLYFEVAPAIFNPKLAAFMEEVSKAISTDATGPSAFLDFKLETDQTRGKVKTFTLEREINIPIEEKRYYSFSPTKTSVHVQLLEMFERLAT